MAHLVRPDTAPRVVNTVSAPKYEALLMTCTTDELWPDEQGVTVKASYSSFTPSSHRHMVPSEHSSTPKTSYTASDCSCVRSASPDLPRNLGQGAAECSERAHERGRHDGDSVRVNATVGHELDLTIRDLIDLPSTTAVVRSLPFPACLWLLASVASRFRICSWRMPVSVSMYGAIAAHAKRVNKLLKTYFVVEGSWRVALCEVRSAQPCRGSIDHFPDSCLLKREHCTETEQK